MAFDLSTARPVSGGFDLSTAKPVDEEDQAPGKPGYYQNLRESLVPPDPSQPTDAMAPDSAMQVINEYAHTVGVAPAQLLDMPSHVVNWLMKKAGSDKRLPATMEQNWNELVNYPGPSYMQDTPARDAVQGAGLATGFAMGATRVARAPGFKAAAADLFGLGNTTPVRVAGAATDMITQGPAKTRAEVALRGGRGDVEGARYMLEETADEIIPGVKAARAVKDPAQANVIKQGFDPGLTAMIKDTNASTKERMRRMVGIVGRAKKNIRHRFNRPSDVLGESVVNRIKVVHTVNKTAAKKLDRVADDLRGQRIDIREPVASFLSDLKQLDIEIDPRTMELNFDESMIEGMDDLQGIIRRLVKRFHKTKVPDAYDAHRAKRYIDHQVTFGKKMAGLDGQIESIFKRFRHNIDGVLDANFPEYDAVNSQYSETIGALDDLQKAMGQRINFFAPNADTAVGTAMRKLTTNYNTRQELDTTYKMIEDLARKYVNAAPTNEVVPYGTIVRNAGVKSIDDSVMDQLQFVNELESMFGTHATGSLPAAIEKGASRAIRYARSPEEGVIGLLDEAIHKARGISEEGALNSLLDLLKD